MAKTPMPLPVKVHQNSASNLLPVPAASEQGGEGDSLAEWAEHYFRFEVTTSQRSQKEQRRDLDLFLRFMAAATGTLERNAWTPRVSRAFVDTLRKELDEGGSRHYSDRTINRMAARGRRGMPIMPMPRRRADGKRASARGGRVKAASRANGSAPALALTRPSCADHPAGIRSSLTRKTVAHPDPLPRAGEGVARPAISARRR